MPTSGVEELMDMGYSQTQANKALEVAHGDLEQAVGFLLMGEQSRAGFDHINESLNLGSLRDPSVNLGSLPEQSVTVGGGNGNGHNSFAFGSDSNHARPPPPQSSTQAAPASSNVQEMMSMGYSSQQAQQALAVSHGDLDQAINFLLMGESRTGFLMELESSFSVNDDGDLAFAAALQHAELSSNQQPHRPESAMYHASGMRNDANVPKMVATQSFLMTPEAGPFCTCMAASKFLNGGVMTSEGLNDMMQGGTELYRKTSGNSEYSIEKVLKKFGKSNLKIEAVVKGEEEPKNGVFMEHDLKHNTGLRTLMAQCRMEQETGWGVILLETQTDSFCLTLAPKGSKNKFWLFDFTPRPMFRVPGAYARVHSSLLSLEESLESILKIMSETQQREFVSFALYTIKKTK
jgi:hypothetical protein